MTHNKTQVKIKNEEKKELKEELQNKPTPGTRLENERMKLYRQTIVKKTPKKRSRHSVPAGAVKHLEFIQNNDKDLVVQQEPQTKPKQGFKLQAQKDIELFHNLITNDPKRGEIHL